MGAHRIERLIGVYNANAGGLGELRYVFGKVVGRAHCGLCDITHGRVRERRVWRRARDRLGVPVHLVHLNELSADIEAACDGPPCVLAQADGALVRLLVAEELDACAGDVGAFEVEVRRAATAIGLALPQLPPLAKR